MRERPGGCADGRAGHRVRVSPGAVAARVLRACNFHAAASARVLRREGSHVHGVEVRAEQAEQG